MPGGVVKSLCMLLYQRVLASWQRSLCHNPVQVKPDSASKLQCAAGSGRSISICNAASPSATSPPQLGSQGPDVRFLAFVTLNLACQRHDAVREISCAVQLHPSPCTEYWSYDHADLCAQNAEMACRKRTVRSAAPSPFQLKTPGARVSARLGASPPGQTCDQAIHSPVLKPPAMLSDDEEEHVHSPQQSAHDRIQHAAKLAGVDEPSSPTQAAAGRSKHVCEVLIH
jgi:hypothetical protein